MVNSSKSISKVQTVYFDESGFTGNHLLNPDQPAFVYASVAISPDHASHLHSELISRFQIEGKELKGKNLVRFQRGQQAISWLLAECKDHSRITVSNKKYALAGKFFEYIFEPLLASRNSFFYHIGFHKFIATLLYMLFQSKSAHAEDILREFEALMRSKDLRHLESLLSPVDKGLSLSDPLGQILTFTLCHRQRIAGEIRRLDQQNDSVSKWALELTTTSLFWLLSYWGGRFESLEVYCDQSKPLETDLAIFDAMIGRELYG